MREKVDMSLQILFFLLFIQLLFGNLLADDAIIWKISLEEKRIATKCSENEQETTNSTSFSCPSSVTLLNNELTENLQWSKIQIIETNRSQRKTQPLINGAIENHIFVAILENSDGIAPMMKRITLNIHLQRGNISENSSLAVRWNKLQFPFGLGPWPEQKIMWPKQSATFIFSNDFHWGAGNYSLSVTDGEDNRVFQIQIEHMIKNAVWIPAAEYSKWDKNFLVEWDEDYSNILRPILKRVMNRITAPYTKIEGIIDPDVDYFQENSTYFFYCQFTGDPFSFENTFISWQSPRCEGKKDCDPNRPKQMSFQLETDKYLLIRAVMAKESGLYTCGYNTTRKTNLQQREFVVTDTPDGSGIYSELLSDSTATYEGDQIKIRCWFNRYRYDGLTAFIESSSGNINGTTRLVNETKHSVILELIIPYATSHETGQYVCKAATYDKTRFDNRVRQESENGTLKFGQSKPINITVLKIWKPTFGNKTTPAKAISHSKGSPVELVCQAFGAPPPKIVWTKDGKPINCDGVKCQIEASPTAQSETMQKLKILSADLSDTGKYSCLGQNRQGNETVSFDVTIEDSSGHIVVLYVCLPVTLIVTVVCGVLAFLWFKQSKEKKAKRLAELKALKEEIKAKAQSTQEKLNYEIPTNDQTDILNNIGTIIPPDMVQVEITLLGRGAFGKVYSGYVKEGGCRIAAKYPEDGLDPEQQRNLLREIKLMTYTGRHPNVLHLLGSVIENMDCGELYAVLEYCQLGSLKDYILGRKYFQSILSPEDITRSVKEKITARSSYAAVTEKETSIKRKKYSSPFQSTGSNAMDDSINTLDLLSFGYQIACGMAHLASKHIVHRDIALRNMLLTDLYIVKVADFGLARKQQGTGENSKDTPVPIRWMALEALSEGQFGSESDIWAFGVMLWELFSLGDEPFAEFSEITPLVIHLKEGVRLPKPAKCPLTVYELMRQCWAENKANRPSFEECKNVFTELAHSISPDYWARALNLMWTVQNPPAQYTNLIDPSIYLSIEDDKRVSSDESRSSGSLEIENRKAWVNENIFNNEDDNLINES